ncbi:MAG: hypothetical protein ACREBE_17005 [bacterium]
MEKKPRKSARIELTPQSKKPPREQSTDESEGVDLKLDELEERVTPRPIGTFF